MADNVSVNFEYTDRRTLTLKQFNDHEADMEFSRLLAQAVREGYVIKSASERTSGHQRDPYTVGITVVLERKEPPNPPVAVRPLTSRAFS